MRIILLIVSLLMMAVSLAETPLELDTINIKSSEENLMSMNFQVFERSDFNNRYENLSDFLQQLNGIQVQQSGGLGNPALASIRGANSSQTLVLINGVTTNSGQYGSYDLDSIPLNQIETIEISRSGSSFYLNDQAIGGTINIITRKNSSSQNLAVRAGSESTFAISSNNQLWKGSTLQLDHEESANNYEYPVPSPFHDSQNRNHIQQIKNAEFKRSSLQLNQVLGTISLVARVNQQRKNIPDYFRNSPENSANLSQETYSFNISDHTKFSHNFNEVLFSSTHNWQGFFQSTEEKYKDPQGVIGLDTDNDHFKQYKMELQGSSILNFKNLAFQFQLKAAEEGFSSRYHDDVDSYECLTPQGDCEQLAFQQSLTSLFATQWLAANRSHEATLDIYITSDTSYNRKRSTVKNSIEDKHSFTGFNANYSYYFDEHELNISIKDTYKAPSLFQRYGDRGLLLGNDDLLGESSQTVAADLLFRFNKSNEITTSVFFRELDNAIVPVYDSRGVGRYENSSQAFLTGLESMWRFTGTHVYGNASIDLYDSNVIDNNIKSFNNKKLAGIYHTSLRAQLGWRYGNHDIALTQQVNRDIYIDRSNLIIGEDNIRSGISYKYAHDNLQLGARIKNLINNQYKDFTNRPAIGRQWLLFLNYSFK